MPSHPAGGQWLIEYIQDFERILQQRVCSGVAPDSLFITLPIAKRRCETKNCGKDIKKDYPNKECI